VTWNNGKNKLIEGLVASLAILEKRVKELEEDKSAKNVKIEDLENQLRNLSSNPNTNSNNPTNANWVEVVRGNSKLNETQTNILNVVGNEQNQRRRKQRNVILFRVPVSKAATLDLQIKEDKETVKEIFNEIGLLSDADSMISVTRINPILARQQQIVQLKQLITTRNDSNKKLEEANASSSTVATYRYGIRNDRVVKVFFKKV